MSCQANGHSLRKPIPTGFLLYQSSQFMQYVGCPVTRERKQWKKNQNSIFKLLASARESIRLRECVDTEFDLEVKTGIEKSVRK